MAKITGVVPSSICGICNFRIPPGGCGFLVNSLGRPGGSTTPFWNRIAANHFEMQDFLKYHVQNIATAMYGCKNAAMPQSILVGKSGPATKMQTCQGSKVMDSLPCRFSCWLAGYDIPIYFYIYLSLHVCVCVQCVYIYIYIYIHGMT